MVSLGGILIAHMFRTLVFKAGKSLHGKFATQYLLVSSGCASIYDDTRFCIVEVFETLEKCLSF